MDLKLDPETNDLDLTNGTVSLVDGNDAIAQECRIRCRYFKGENFLDTREGIPFFQKIIGQKRKKSIVDAYFKRVLLTTPGVARIDSFSTTFDGTNRRLTISFTVVTEDGTVLTFDDLFLVEG